MEAPEQIPEVVVVVVVVVMVVVVVVAERRREPEPADRRTDTSQSNSQPIATQVAGQDRLAPRRRPQAPSPPVAVRKMPRLRPWRCSMVSPQVEPTEPPPHSRPGQTQGTGVHTYCVPMSGKRG